MRIHALTTGTVRIKDAFLHARTDWRRQVDLFLPGEWSDPLPVHCWAVEHDGTLLLVDTGDVAGARALPFARPSVRADEELPSALAAAGLSIDDVDRVVLTHLHADHMAGAVHVRCPVEVHDEELAVARSPRGRLVQKVFRQPLPDVRWQPFSLGGPFGAFERAAPLTDDGRVMAVATPGHTLGHVSIVCVDDERRHVVLAGDLTDTLEQFHARRPDGVATHPKREIRSMDAVAAHAREHPTIYLPSHDPESAARLAAGTTL